MVDAALAWASRELTAFHGFREMADPRGGYRPTLRTEIDWRFAVLAEHYNKEMMRRRLPRRAFTPDLDLLDDGHMLLMGDLGWQGRSLVHGEVPSYWRVFSAPTPRAPRASVVPWLRGFARGRVATVMRHVYDMHRERRRPFRICGSRMLARSRQETVSPSSASRTTASMACRSAASRAAVSAGGGASSLFGGGALR